MRVPLLLLSLFTLSQSDERKETKWPDNTPVIMLTCDNFDRYTKLGWESVDTPWFVFFWTTWCPACPRMVPIWESLTRKFTDNVNMAAMNGEECPEMVHRYGVPNYPHFIYFAQNNQMYRFDGVKNEENLTDYITNERWQDRIEEGEDIPIDINPIKQFFRKATHPIMIPIGIVVCFVCLVIYIFIEDRKYEKAKMVEAKEVKKELVRREQVRREKEERAKQQLTTGITHEEEEEKQTLLQKQD